MSPRAPELKRTAGLVARALGMGIGTPLVAVANQASAQLGLEPGLTIKDQIIVAADLLGATEQDAGKQHGPPSLSPQG